ncbi:MAG: hypothetical protein AVDCRST_MAG93-2697 [uncultured Chloroflexia bacterium]|uniref:Uncharacterized protein n=1 Tax=uncultured Chloroflexia bacterium TaxID=1672391 RepID=A0A6J4JBQ7_9CHLR|nr:MAG: hypothetical protein AVDCRST_MAG93-2697 [uncultured Chloroflexia bacterium]
MYFCRPCSGLCAIVTLFAIIPNSNGCANKDLRRRVGWSDSCAANTLNKMLIEVAAIVAVADE